jgi:hypothetical protein
MGEPPKLDYASPDINRPTNSVTRGQGITGLIGFLLYGAISLGLIVAVVAILCCAWPMVLLDFPEILFLPAAVFFAWRALVGLRQFRESRNRE